MKLIVCLVVSHGLILTAKGFVLPHNLLDRETDKCQKWHYNDFLCQNAISKKRGFLGVFWKKWGFLGVFEERKWGFGPDKTWQP